MDELTVVVEAHAHCTDRDGEASNLQTTIKELIGVTATVRVVAPETLERSAGKAQRLKDLR
jgi:phenylacetate-CoA ligase